MKTNTNPKATGRRLVRGAQRAARVTTVVLAGATLTGCEVTNPGLVEDTFLNDPRAYEAMVHGSAASLAILVNNFMLITGHAAREIFPSGQNGPGGVDNQIYQAGHFLVEDGLTARWWEDAHQ